MKIRKPTKDMPQCILIRNWFWSLFDCELKVTLNENYAGTPEDVKVNYFIFYSKLANFNLFKLFEVNTEILQGRWMC